MGSVAAARKVSPNWSLETMTCHSSNFFSLVRGQGNARDFSSEQMLHPVIFNNTDLSNNSASLCLSFTGGALLDLMQRCDEPPPSPGKRVLCRHPFDEAKRAYVCPSAVEALYRVYWKDGKVLNQTSILPNIH